MKKSLKLVLIITVVLIVLGSGIFYYIYSGNKIITIVTMDINPSVVISLNSHNEVVKIESLNDDGNTLLEDSNYVGKSLEATINGISEELISKGFVSEEDLTILISIDGEKIENEVNSIIVESFNEKY